MLSLSDVTLALPRQLKFQPGEAGIRARTTSMNFVFDIFREFVVSRQEPRNQKIAQMSRRISELDMDFQAREIEIERQTEREGGGGGETHRVSE
jgi:hypothetical protein